MRCITAACVPSMAHGTNPSHGERDVQKRRRNWALEGRIAMDWSVCTPHDARRETEHAPGFAQEGLIQSPPNDSQRCLNCTPPPARHTHQWLDNMDVICKHSPGCSIGIQPHDRLQSNLGTNGSGTGSVLHWTDTCRTFEGCIHANSCLVGHSRCRSFWKE